MRSLCSRLFTAALLLPVTAATAWADSPDGEDLSATQTAYKGAWILEGGQDVDFGGHGPGAVAEDEAQGTYAFFTGNTLYVGAEDSEGNGVDAIVEFFWFESSIDRGSDFYVAVIKTKTSPNRNEDWALDTGDDAPVIYVDAHTDTSRGTGSFRWDWSSPFENYGMDSYGEVKLETEYGIGLQGEGSATYAEKIKEDGTTASVDVQAKGYLDSDFYVSTQYQVTLWRWELAVDGAPHNMRWDMTLHNSDREDENAYHEFFLVMQADAGEPFTIDELDIGGHVNGWWWGQDNGLSVAVNDIVLSRPQIDQGIGDEDPVDPGDDVDPIDDRDPGLPGGELDGEDEAVPGGCSTAPGAALGWAWLGLAGLAAARRRR